MGPYLLAILFLAIPPQVLSPSLESGVRSRLEKGRATQTISGIIREVRFGILRASTGFEVRWQIPAVEQPLRLDLAINPLRLAKSFLLPDGSRFRAPDRLLGWTWGLGPLF